MSNVYKGATDNILVVATMIADGVQGEWYHTEVKAYKLEEAVRVRYKQQQYCLKDGLLRV